MSAVRPLERLKALEALCHDDGALALDAIRRLQAGVLVCSATGEIMLANPMASRILGRTTLEGQPIAPVFATPAALRYQARHPDARAELTLPGTGQMLGYNVSEGAGGELIVLFRDISRQVRLREERDRLMQLSTVGDMLPAVLHELRNPLAAVTSAIEVLVDSGEDEDPADLMEALGSILNELRRMGLVFQGIGAVGRRLLSQRASRLDLATREVMRVMRHYAHPKGVILDASIDELPALPVDPAIFKAIVFNLISNAVHACRRGDRVIITLRHVAQHITFSVRDEGVGMTRDVLEQCTRPFYTTRANGSGLGLVICKEAVEEAGGHLSIASEPGEGTIVLVILGFESWTARAGRG